MQPAAAQQLAHLLNAGAVDLVEVEQLADLGQREAQPLAAQDPAEPRAVAGAVQPGQALAARLDQALVLVEADGARRDRELAGEFGDAVDALRCRAVLELLAVEAAGGAATDMVEVS